MVKNGDIFYENGQKWWNFKIFLKNGENGENGGSKIKFYFDIYASYSKPILKIILVSKVVKTIFANSNNNEFINNSLITMSYKSS